MGAVAVIRVSEWMTKGAAVVPKKREVVSVNPLPMIETAVPPVEGPTKGVIFVTMGTLNKGLIHIAKKQRHSIQKKRLFIDYLLMTIFLGKEA